MSLVISERGNVSLKNWYIVQHSTDEVGLTLNPDTTINDVITALNTNVCFYKTVGGESDSIVRERVFEMISTLLGVEYKVVYDQWLS